MAAVLVAMQSCYTGNTLPYCAPIAPGLQVQSACLHQACSGFALLQQRLLK